MLGFIYSSIGASWDLFVYYRSVFGRVFDSCLGRRSSTERGETAMIIGTGRHYTIARADCSPGQARK